MSDFRPDETLLEAAESMVRALDLDKRNGDTHWFEGVEGILLRQAVRREQAKAADSKSNASDVKE